MSYTIIVNKPGTLPDPTDVKTRHGDLDDARQALGEEVIRSGGADMPSDTERMLYAIREAPEEKLVGKVWTIGGYAHTIDRVEA